MTIPLPPKSFFKIKKHYNQPLKHQELALKMYRDKQRVVPKIMCELFNEANVPYNLRQDVSFQSYNVKTVLYGIKTLSYLGPKNCNLVPFDIRDCVTEQIFHQKIKIWKPE